MNNAQTLTLTIFLLLLAGERAEAASIPDKDCSAHAADMTSSIGLHLEYEAKPIVPPRDTPIEVPSVAMDLRAFPPSFSVSPAQFGPR